MMMINSTDKHWSDHSRLVVVLGYSGKLGMEIASGGGGVVVSGGGGDGGRKGGGQRGRLEGGETWRSESGESE